MGEGGAGYLGKGNRENNGRKIGYPLEPTAAGNGNISISNRKFVYYNIAGNRYCLILSEISFD